MPAAGQSIVEPPQVVTLVYYTVDELYRLLIKSLSNSHETLEGDPDGSHRRTMCVMLVESQKRPGFKGTDTLTFVVEMLQDRRRVREDRQSRQKRVNETEMPKSDVFIKGDMIGEQPEDMAIQSAAWKTLHDMVGLDDVKAAVKAALLLHTANFYRKLLGLPVKPVLMNRCFLGQPGTGKTTAAKLYAEILQDIGLIEEDVGFKQALELIGPYVGHSEERTKHAFAEAEGSILIVDEFHRLYEEDQPDTFRKAVIDTWVGLIRESSDDQATSVV